MFQYRMGQPFICCHAAQQINICMAQENSINYKILFNDTTYTTHTIRHTYSSHNKSGIRNEWGHAVAQLVEALCYKSEGRGFDSRWCHWNFSLT